MKRNRNYTITRRLNEKVLAALRNEVGNLFSNGGLHSLSASLYFQYIGLVETVKNNFKL